MTEVELNIMQLISYRPPDCVGSILDLYCETIASYVRLAIYNKRVREWCRNHNLEKWEKALKHLGKFTAFNCEFKIPKKLPVFDLLAGSMLINEYLGEEKVANKIVILYVAMDVFNSIFATSLILCMTINNFEKKSEKQIPSVLKILENSALIHGCPAYLHYCRFWQKVGIFYLQENREEKAAAALQLGYQFLLTAAKLEKECADELYNSSHGEYSQWENPSFSSMIKEYEHHYLSFIPPPKVSAAQQAAESLSQTWIMSAKK
jgi:hypothetical protein